MQVTGELQEPGAVRLIVRAIGFFHVVGFDGRDPAIEGYSNREKIEQEVPLFIAGGVQGSQEQVPVVIVMIFIQVQQMLEAEQEHDHIGVIVPGKHYRVADGPEAADLRVFGEIVQYSFLQDMICYMVAKGEAK